MSASGSWSSCSLRSSLELDWQLEVEVLPRDVLLKTFEFLDMPDLLLLRRVNKAFRNLLRQYEHMVIRVKKQRTLEAVISAFTSANELELNFNQTADSTMWLSLTKLSRLSTLQLGGIFSISPMYSPDVLDLLRELPRLQTLKLFGVDVSYGPKWTKLVSLSKLRQVSFSWLPGREALECVASLPRLQNLRIAGVTTATAGEYMLLTRLSSLTDLALTMPVRWGSPDSVIPQRFFEALSSLTRLEIGLSAPHMLDSLTVLHFLEELNLSAGHTIMDRYAMPPLTSLRRLELHSCDCRPAFFLSLSQQTWLTSLRLLAFVLSSKDASPLRAFVCLRHLCLQKATLPPDALSHIAGLSSLISIELSDKNVSLKSSAAAQASPGGWLHFDSLRHLQNLTNLRQLHIPQHPNASLYLISRLPLLSTVTLPAGPERKLVLQQFSHIRVLLP